MGLRYFSIGSQDFVEIPPEQWKCPHCQTDELTVNDDRPQPKQSGVYFPDTELYCDNCGKVSAMQLYRAACDDEVICPCCYNSCSLSKDRAEEVNQLLIDNHLKWDDKNLNGTQ